MYHNNSKHKNSLTIRNPIKFKFNVGIIVKMCHLRCRAVFVTHHSFDTKLWNIALVTQHKPSVIGNTHLELEISLIEELRARCQYRMDHHSMEVSILKILRTPVTWHFGLVWLVLAAQVSADDYFGEIQSKSIVLHYHKNCHVLAHFFRSLSPNTFLNCILLTVFKV